MQARALTVDERESQTDSPMGRMMAARMAQPANEDLRGAFVTFDLDEDGALSEKEFVGMMAHLGYKVDRSYVNNALVMYGETQGECTVLRYAGFVAMWKLLHPVVADPNSVAEKATAGASKLFGNIRSKVRSKIGADVQGLSPPPPPLPSHTARESICWRYVLSCWPPLVIAVPQQQCTSRSLERDVIAHQST